MSHGFDVYHKWLSIPPSEQPPNHYRLLGLELFEHDPDVIAAAADRQMAHVQTYKNGPQADLSQRLLNEIASAKLCLLKPPKREPYDARLRQELAARQAAQTPVYAASAGGPAASPLPPPIPVPPRLDDLPAASARLPLATTALFAAGAVVILLLLVAIVAILVQRSGSNPHQRPGTGSAAGGASKAGADLATNIPAKPAPSAHHRTVEPAPGNPSIHPGVNPYLPLPPNHPSGAKPPAAAGNSGAAGNPAVDSGHSAAKTEIPVSATDPSARPKPAVGNPLNPPPTKPNVADVRANSAQMLDKTKSPQPGVPDLPKKLLVPDLAAQRAASARLATAFADPAPAEVLERSKQLDDGPLVYVALDKALHKAVAEGDVALVGQIVDELSRRFTVETLPLRAAAAIDLRRHVTSQSGWAALGESSLGMIDEAVAADQIDLALRLAETSLLAARKSGNLDLIRRATLRIVRLQEKTSGVPVKDAAASDTGKSGAEQNSGDKQQTPADKKANDEPTSGAGDNGAGSNGAGNTGAGKGTKKAGGRTDPFDGSNTTAPGKTPLAGGNA